jgi:hypothetical protein
VIDVYAKRTFKAYKDKVLKEFAKEEQRAAVMAWWPFD